MRIRNLDAGHPDIAKMHNNLGRLLLDMGDAPAAVASLELALEMLLAGLGEEHPFVAGVRHNLALALHKAGNSVRALPMAQQALEARRRLLGDDHEETRETESLLDNILQSGK